MVSVAASSERASRHTRLSILRAHGPCSATMRWMRWSRHACDTKPLPRRTFIESRPAAIACCSRVEKSSVRLAASLS